MEKIIFPVEKNYNGGNNILTTGKLPKTKTIKKMTKNNRKMIFNTGKNILTSKKLFQRRKNYFNDGKIIFMMKKA